MLYSFPNHELSIEIIMQNFYARLSCNDQTMLDTSCVGSFMKKTIVFQWDLLERIKRNSEDWELDKGKESGIKLEYDCVKSFMDTDGVLDQGVLTTSSPDLLDWAEDPRGRILMGQFGRLPHTRKIPQDLAIKTRTSPHRRIRLGLLLSQASGALYKLRLGQSIDRQYIQQSYRRLASRVEPP